MANNVGQIIMQGRSGNIEELNVYVSLNIDDVLDFSYFIIAFNNGDSWWLVTDEPKFANPSAKEGIAHRGSSRYRENDYDNTIFPYIFLDHIIEWRENNRSVDRPGGGNKEMYTVPLLDWPLQCRVMLNLLIERLLPKFQEDNNAMQRMKFGYEYTNALLLENKSYNPEEWKCRSEYFEYQNSNASKRIENMIFDEKNCRALKPFNTSQVVEKISLWNGGLMTDGDFAKLEAWAICDSEYQRRKGMLESVEQNRKSDELRMFKMLNDNFSNRIETLFAAREMHVFIYEPDVVYKESNSAFNGNRDVYMLRLHSNSNDHFYMMDIPGVVGGSEEELCGRCGKFALKKNHTSVLFVHHYALLAWLAGVKREQLPHWFINYGNYIYNGYYGNHLLDNINPMYRLKDVLSQRRPNGLTFNIRVCQRCRTAMGKSAMDKGVLVVNKQTCELEGVFSIPNFKAWINDKGINCDFRCASVGVL